MKTKTQQRDRLTLRDRLSRLDYRTACKLLGEEGPRLIREGGQRTIEVVSQVSLDDDALTLRLHGRDSAKVVISLTKAARRRLQFRCSSCTVACAHIGAAFSLILEEKMELGLSAPPKDRVPVESLGEEELVQLALDERRERARTEKMTVRAADRSTPWTDYAVTSALSGRTYRVALRGLEPGESYCTCPDFRKNTLGTCKHVLNVAAKVRKRFGAAALAAPYRPREIAVYLAYGKRVELRVLVPRIREERAKALLEPLRGREVIDIHDLLRRVRKLELLGRDVVIYPDAEEFIQQRLHEARLSRLVEEIRAAPAKHALRRELLRVELLPYQLDGVAFAAGAGRAILADDMGLGKTIQGVGVAELLAREVGVSKVLIVCPASLKSQWAAEIERFCSRDSQLILGPAKERVTQYANRAFFTICNYEQVIRYILAIEAVDWDLIILDEAQRIKKWEAKTTRTVKGLRSRFALALSGTPLENRLDELYSVVEFIDDRRLGPAFRFLNRHRVVDEKGKVLGFRNLDELRKNLKPVLLRRTRASVMKQLPPRTTEILRVAPTFEQLEVHRGWMSAIQTIVNKPYLTEMDLLRLQRALLMCRMVANSTFLVDKKPPGFSTKLARLDELVEQLSREADRKIVLFSEWTTMLDLVEKVLRKHGIRWVRLDGSVPQKKRAALVRQFRDDPECRLFMTTNAGATGLNLQAANTVINVDLPWNPAILEQRVGRAHRMGQKRPVQVYLLVTEDTLEENLLNTLSAKHALATAALDFESDVDEVDLQSGMEELRSRLEELLGAREEASIDEREKSAREKEARQLARAERVAAASGEAFTSALGLISAILPDDGENSESQRIAAFLEERLRECVQTDDEGRPRLTLTLPDETALGDLSRSLASLLALGGREASRAPDGPARN